MLAWRTNDLGVVTADIMESLPAMLQNLNFKEGCGRRSGVRLVSRWERTALPEGASWKLNMDGTYGISCYLGPSSQLQLVSCSLTAILALLLRTITTSTSRTCSFPGR